MTNDEIIEMAVQAGIAKEVAEVNIDIMEAFAKLVAQHERDACAKEAERTFYSVQAAENIRARGKA